MPALVVSTLKKDGLGSGSRLFSKVKEKRKPPEHAPGNSHPKWETKLYKPVFHRCF